MISPVVLILAAGEGKRMNSSLPKVLHSLAGKPMLSHLLTTVKQLKPKKTIVVFGHQAKKVKETFRDSKVTWVLQKKQKGTADAVLSASRVLLGSKGPLFILYGDVPLLRIETLRQMQRSFYQEKATLTFLTTFVKNPTSYGRIIRNTAGEVIRIVEEKDATAEEKKVCEVNSGLYLVDCQEVLKGVREIEKSLVTGEYYLTDLIEQFLRKGKKVVSVVADDSQECLGINSRLELARAESQLRRRINESWMARGVTMRNPDSISIDADVMLERDVQIHQGVVVTGKSRIHKGAEILPYSVIEESEIKSFARIGPFAHLRPGSVVGEGGHVGNFVELKKARLMKGVKANHLSYLGDTVIGEGTNVGAGTITCNYDGFKKHKTVIGKNVFIGSDVQFVAPVKVENGAWIAAGTTVTKKVPRDSLAITRVEQKNINGWVKRRKRSRH
ncbi:MAG: bifunctional UDP-N-acetylglucosamine diphosphorylase/glucosamine-1-phosphate N-acetyltransferase GlmU [Deltaproteobacteria bacterium]|nr:bifunctional UDP-N-acetylglucosamine diphosphorylase/glucosamine-1-phosphate N-acetyltransferase GlmU [Deltaproteobacteria bacterium]